MSTITQGRYEATIRQNGEGFLVLVTRNGDCLHGIPSKFYDTKVKAEKGARRMLDKAAA